ncbi:MAG TPA: hypothetical protein VHO47_04760 [Candidatus Babeliales bacterium]|nr:hypothetical protein [Candidatus Babeliales bacterium]
MKFYKLFFAFFFLNFLEIQQVHAHDTFQKIKSHALLETAKNLDHPIFWGGIFAAAALCGYRIGNSIDNIKVVNQPKLDAVMRAGSIYAINLINNQIDEKVKPYQYGLWPILGVGIVSGLRFIMLTSQK